VLDLLHWIVLYALYAIKGDLDDREERKQDQEEKVLLKDPTLTWAEFETMPSLHIRQSLIWQRSLYPIFLPFFRRVICVRTWIKYDSKADETTQQ
jgi:hypothetical protein